MKHANALFAKFVSTLKSEKWSIDDCVPFSYLLGLVVRKFFMYIRGIVCFGQPSKVILLGKSTIIRCKSKIRLMGVINVDNNCYIDALSKNGIVFGKNVSIGKNTTIECSGSLRNVGVGLIVGDNVGLGTHGFFGCAGGVVVGENSIFGNFVSIHSENHNFQSTDTPIRLQGVNRTGVIIGSDCWIGAKVTILDGAIIGNGCIVAAGAVVKKGSYADNSIIGGVPAKVIGLRSRL